MDVQRNLQIEENDKIRFKCQIIINESLKIKIISIRNYIYVVIEMTKIILILFEIEIRMKNPFSKIKRY